MSIDVFFEKKEPREIRNLRIYDKLYYNEGTSPISDSEYDELKEQAKKIYPDHPYFQEVGSPVDGKKVKLPFILGSLKKVKIDSVEDWLEKYENKQTREIILMEKLDGVSILVKYNMGKVAAAYTRGDGYEGRDITNKARIFCPRIDALDVIWLRGEVMLTQAGHLMMGFKTRRNGVAGILNRDDNKNVEKLVPFFYEVVSSPERSIGSWEINKLNFMEGNGLKIPKYKVFNLEEKPYLPIVIKTLEEFKSHSYLEGYDIDGLVLRPMNYVRENEYYPSNTVAFKMNEEPVEARVKGVLWNVSRTGRVKPIVEIEPVDIGGVNVSRATGFNAAFIIDKHIGINSLIRIVRSGDVIPHIVSVEEEQEPDVANVCPSCKSDLFMQGVDLYCRNPSCWTRAYRNTSYFLRKMGAENITEKTLMKLGLENIKDCYEIDEFEIAEMDGFGVKRGEQIVNEINKTLITTPEKLLAALGIPGVGDTVAKSIVDYLRSDLEYEEDVIDSFFTVSKEELLEIEGIGDIIADSYMENIGKFEDLIMFLVGKGLEFKSRDSKVSGKVFTLTGKCEEFSRSYIVDMVIDAGGMVKGISKSTDYLVAADKDTQSTKAKKARSYGIEIISYDDLLKMLR